VAPPFGRPITLASWCEWCAFSPRSPAPTPANAAGKIPFARPTSPSWHTGCSLLPAAPPPGCVRPARKEPSVAHLFHPIDNVPAVAQRNTEAIAQLEQEFPRQRSALDRASDAISAFVGSIQFVLAHAAFFALWILLNLGALGLRPFDPYPFVFLNLVL